MALFTSVYTKQLALAGATHDVHIEGEKKVQKAVNRRTLDPAGPYIKLFQKRYKQTVIHDLALLQPTAAAGLELLPPVAYPHQPATSFNTKFVHVSSNKMKCGISTVVWTPEGRRCMTGTNSGELTLWNGTSFNFETILQAHETAIHSMTWNRNETWLLTGEDSGTLKYWKPNYELVKVASVHKEALRDIAFSPTDLKFATASDDSTIRVWDFARCEVDKLVTGHGGDVKSVQWHPSKAMLASGSKDGLVKLWDAKSGKALATFHGHKHTVMRVRWNANGHWLLSACRDQTCRVFDVRTHRELAVFHGHGRDVMSIAWHPLHEDLFASGGYDGSLLFWLVSQKGPQAEVRAAHEASIWSLAWHPAGHVLATGSQDTSTKFWCRARPGDPWRDRHQREQEEAAATEGDAPEGPRSRLASVGGPPPDGAIPGIGDAVFPVAGQPMPGPPGIAPPRPHLAPPRPPLAPPPLHFPRQGPHGGASANPGGQRGKRDAYEAFQGGMQQPGKQPRLGSAPASPSQSPGRIMRPQQAAAGIGARPGPQRYSPAHAAGPSMQHSSGMGMPGRQSPAYSMQGSQPSMGGSYQVPPAGPAMPDHMPTGPRPASPALEYGQRPGQQPNYRPPGRQGRGRGRY